MQENVISVAKLCGYIKKIFESEELLHNISVYGEVSGLSISRGIAYFNLKDEDALLPCVYFGINEELNNGDKIIATGTPGYYVKGGKLNFNVIKTKPLREMAQIYDVAEGLENRFKEKANKIKDLKTLLLEVKSKRYTYTRLKRIVAKLVLNISSNCIEKLYEIDKLPYVKVLGFNSNNQTLLNELNCNTNLIIRNSNIVEKPSKLYKELAEIEDNANAVYNQLLTKSSAIADYTPDLLTKTIVYK